MQFSYYKDKVNGKSSPNIQESVALGSVSVSPMKCSLREVLTFAWHEVM